MKVLWLTNIPSPYRLKFFSELGKKVELTVLFEKGYSNERNDSWNDYSFENFNGIVLKGISVLTDMAFSFGYTKYIKQHRYGIIVVSNPITPTGICAIMYMQFHNIEYCIESDGAFPKDNKGFSGALKTRLYSHADYCFTTSELGKQYFINYQVKKDKIKKYPFSSVWDSDIVKKPYSSEEKRKIRESLGIYEEHLILSVGRFIPIKGFDNLLKACNLVSDDCALCIVGGNPGKEYLNCVSESRKNRTYFVDFKTPEELEKYYDAADVFSFTSHGDVWGLVVNEAMSRGIPVISTDKSIAGLEMIRDNQNGFIVTDNDITMLAEKIKEIIYADTYTMFCENAIQMARKYTIETMVERHILLIDKICNRGTEK